MAEINEQVMDRVREELNRDPSMGSRALYRLGQEIDASIAEIKPESFHARYYLPIKREQAAQRREAEQQAEQEQAEKPQPARKARAQKPQAQKPQAQKAPVQKAQAQKAPVQKAQAQKVEAQEAEARKPTRQKPVSPPRSEPARKAAGQPSAAPAAQQAPAPAAVRDSAEPSQDQSTARREQIRAVFLQFAREFAEAESRTEIVQVLSKVDDYVDRVVKQAG